MECGRGHGCPEKRIVDLQVVPVGDGQMESAERVNVHSLTNVVENVQGDSRADSQIIVSHLLGESLDVLDDSGLRQLFENAPVEFGTVLEGEGLRLMLEELLLVSLYRKRDRFG